MLFQRLTFNEEIVCIISLNIYQKKVILKCWIRFNDIFGCFFRVRLPTWKYFFTHFSVSS